MMVNESAASPAQAQAWRCGTCQRILCKLDPVAGSKLEIKCPHCNTVNVLWAVGPVAGAGSNIELR